MIDQDAVVRRRTSMIEAEVDGELVGLEVDQGACYGFNATATRVWALIEEPKRISEIGAALLSEFDVDAETCRTQLVDLLKDLEAQGLVAMEAPRA